MLFSVLLIHETTIPHFAGVFQWHPLSRAEQSLFLEMSEIISRAGQPC